MTKTSKAAKPATIYTKFDKDLDANVQVPAGTPGAIEWMYLDWADRYVTVPGRD